MEIDDLIPIEDLCRHYSVEYRFVCDLSDYQLLDLVNLEEVVYLQKSQLNEFEKWIRLHYELEINLAGIDAIAHLLQKMQSMQAELNELRLRKSLDLTNDTSQFSE